MPLEGLRASLNRLARARVSNVTLTGGEPFLHPHLVAIAQSLVAAGIDVTICTNAVEVEPDAFGQLASLGRVTINVSLDGATAESHGRFRGDRTSFERTLANTKRFAEAGLLKGILSTPNRLAADHEYADLYRLAEELRVDYLLMNPLSRFGRGVKSITRLRKDNDSMGLIQSTIPLRRKDDDPEQVFIRFPNDSQPLGNCIAGDIFYVSVNGDSAVCPYLLFAAETPGALHSPEEFTFGNLFQDADFADRLEEYNFHDRYAMGTNESCTSCSSESVCGKGCPAAVVAGGGRIGDLDSEVCPKTQ
jgi:radical SAM protein with 4Fe4S-binding SPASM domain